MDFELLRERYLPLLKEHMLPIGLGIAGISLIGCGLIYLLVTRSDSSEITFESAQQQVIYPTKTAQKEVLVDVGGAVRKPGIHKLPAESRMQDALLAAGGMSEKADHLHVSRGVNLAAKVTDGMKIYIPFQGETVGTAGDGVQSFLGAQTGGVININTAIEKDLDTLSGVGPATAQKIIGGRPYASVEELLTKKAVGKSVFEKIKDDVTVN
jgi:competence protein ComEA